MNESKATFDSPEAFVAALKRDGKQIGQDARLGIGDKANAAMECVRYYSMWHRCPGDNMSRVLAEKAYAQWKSL